MTDELRVETPESVAFSYPLAGLGSRGLALALDTLVIGAIWLLEFVLVAAVGAVAVLAFDVAPEAAAPWAAGALLILVFTTNWGYFIVFETLGNGRTWGKRRMGIRVVRDDGSRLGAGDAVVRNLVRVIDLLPGGYAVGIVAILSSSRAKRLGDMAAGTVVVRDEAGDEMRFDDGGQPPAVLLAREFLSRRPSLTGPAQVQVGREVLAALGEPADPAWDAERIAARIGEVAGTGPEGGGDRPGL